MANFKLLFLYIEYSFGVNLLFSVSTGAYKNINVLDIDNKINVK